MAGLSALLLGICSIDNDGSVKDYSRYKIRGVCVIVAKTGCGTVKERL